MLMTVPPWRSYCEGSVVHAACSAGVRGGECAALPDTKFMCKGACGLFYKGLSVGRALVCMAVSEIRLIAFSLNRYNQSFRVVKVYVQ